MFHCLRIIVLFCDLYLCPLSRQHPIFQILRGTAGYNEQGMLLLPPRPAGEKLPEEIVRAYEPDPVSNPTLEADESHVDPPEPDPANDRDSQGVPS